MHRSLYALSRLSLYSSPLRVINGEDQAQGLSKKGEVDNGGEADNAENENYDDEDVDIDVSMAIEADADDPEAMAAITVVDYSPGDTLGKLMAFVNQLQMSSEITRDYLFHTCNMQNVKLIELLLWIRI